MTNCVPVITIDGPSGAGKGTICQLIAIKLGFHYLDSGALYRLLVLAAMRHAVDLSNVESLAVLAAHMDISFNMNSEFESQVILEGEDVSALIRDEHIGSDASTIAAHLEVRTALLSRQRAFAKYPGLVADGRDMGTIVFPDAGAKIFLTANSEIRAKRRHKQLMDKGKDASLASLIEQVKKRDERDMTRKSSPMVPAHDAVIIDSSHMSINGVLELGLEIAKKNGIHPQ
ncbi:MAG: (d)CMP kinase [Porticoccus sp.]|tara:strand:+ start:318 stop:1007 length:690 start_codon:yes stop_codon:yes gene_type:complete